MKKISIVTATYNAASRLESLILSVGAQKTEEVEFIIIDGGSTDGTIDIIKQHNVYVDYWVSERDKGIYDAWNKGIGVAKGQWVMFLGADDSLLPDALSNFLEFLSSENSSSYDYISAHNHFVNSEGVLLKLLGEGAEWKLMRRMNSAAHVGSLHNKQTLFETVGYYSLDYKICADYELLLRKGPNLRSYFLPKVIARMEVGGMSFSLKAIKETYRIRKQHKTVPTLFNMFLFFRDYMGYTLFKLRKPI